MKKKVYSNLEKNEGFSQGKGEEERKGYHSHTEYKYLKKLIFFR